MSTPGSAVVDARSADGRPVPVVLDVDTGTDDALALLLAVRSPGLDLRAVTCVAGNADVDQVVANTIRVLDAAGAGEVLLARGATRPLLQEVGPPRRAHGTDGMADLGLPASDRPVDPRGAVVLLRDLLLEAADRGEPLVLVTLGPLTNVALLARTHPEALAGLARVVLMGGSALAGNATAAAEFNVYQDPEAAAVVLDATAEAGVPVTMYGLDVFEGPRVTMQEAQRLVASPDPGTRLAGLLLTYRCQRHGEQDTAIGDAGAVCAVLDPGGLATRPLPVRVELAGTWTRGQTVVDQRANAALLELDLERQVHAAAPAVVDVGLAVDGGSYARLWLEAVAP